MDSKRREEAVTTENRDEVSLRYLNLKSMKKVFILLLIAFFAWSCQEEEESPVTHCIQVQLIEEVCGQAILQVINPTPFDLAQATWQKSNGEVLYNVFSTNLSCFAAQLPVDGSSFYVKIEAQIPQTLANCVMCLALPPEMPPTFHYVSYQANCNTTD
jgi:hypothetical protein